MVTHSKRTSSRGRNCPDPKIARDHVRRFGIASGVWCSDEEDDPAWPSGGTWIAPRHALVSMWPAGLGMAGHAGEMAHAVGFLALERGSVELAGKPVRLRSPCDPQRAGARGIPVREAARCAAGGWRRRRWEARRRRAGDVRLPPYDVDGRAAIAFGTPMRPRTAGKQRAPERVAPQTHGFAGLNLRRRSTVAAALKSGA